MDVKEKLVELVRNAHKKCKAKKTCHECEQYGNGSDCVYLFMADELIAHGVTVHGLGGCEYCNGLPFSQMEDFTMPNASKKDYDIVTIRFCPMCGRRLPQPPKGE